MNDHNYFLFIAGIRLASSDKSPFAVSHFADIRATIVDETAPTLTTPSPTANNHSSSVSLQMQRNTTEVEHHQQQEKSTADLSVDVTELYLK